MKKIIQIILFLLPINTLAQNPPRWEVGVQSFRGKDDGVLRGWGSDIAFYPFRTGAFQWGVSLGARYGEMVQYLSEMEPTRSLGSRKGWCFPIMVKGKCNMDVLTFGGVSPFVSLSVGYSFSNCFVVSDSQGRQTKLLGMCVMPELGLQAGPLYAAAVLWLQAIRPGLKDDLIPGGSLYAKSLCPTRFSPAFSVRFGLRF